MKTDRTYQSLRIGLFGGTFNPIHIGHQQAALEILAQFDLGRIYFIPSALPPHKSRGALATAGDRFEMVRLAIADHPQLSVSDVELQRPGPSYTIDTIKHFKAKSNAECRIFFIIGSDAFLSINTWKSFRNLLAQSAFIVMRRPKAEATGDTFRLRVTAFAQQYICSEYQWSPSRRALVHTHYQPIHLARIKPVDIASSQIRHMLREGRDITQWISPAVVQYINQKDLYR